MRSKLLFTVVILTACGKQPAEIVKQGNVSELQTNSMETREYALKVDNKRDLFDCTDEHDKQLVYVVETAEMLTCDKRTWVAIDLKGKAGRDGKDGQDGQQGIAGRDGVDGVAGQDGVDGQDGQQGIQGIQGQQGIAGTNGIDAANINVINPDGSILGALININYSTNEYYILATNGLRYQFDPTSGHFPNAYRVFSGANCTGTSRIVITNGQFGNVFVDGTNDTVTYKTTSQNLGTWNYASRIPGATNCQNTAGSALRTYTYEQTTLPRYPLTNTEIDNGTN